MRGSYAGHRAPTFAKRNFLHRVDESEAAVIAEGTWWARDSRRAYRIGQHLTAVVADDSLSMARMPWPYGEFRAASLR